MPCSSTPRVEGKYLVEKFEGKGGWTYVAIPEIKQDPFNPFGWVQISGHVDDYQLLRVKLMPMGDGKLFLPLKEVIRKAIGKKEGDTVQISIYIDNSKLMIPPAILSCFEVEDPKLLDFFKSLPDGDKQSYIDWIYAAKKDETFESRIVTLMERMNKGLRFGEEA